MKLRFKLRTLLIATALVAVPLGLQVHVHHKAKRFVEEMRPPPELHTSQEFTREQVALLAPVSPVDLLLLRRRCRVMSDAEVTANGFYYHYLTFHVGLVGEPKLQ